MATSTTLDFASWQAQQRAQLVQELLDVEIACAHITIVDGRATCGQTREQVKDLFDTRNTLRTRLIALNDNCEIEADRIGRDALAETRECSPLYVHAPWEV